jgi:hypothetical protein
MTVAYYEKQLAAADQISRSTVHFFRGTTKKPESHGSGVYFKSGQSGYILTAAHVIEGHEQDLQVRSPSGLQGLGFRAITNKINFHRDDDKADIGILELNQQTIADLDELFLPVTIQEIGLNHNLIYSLCYLAYGYPVTLTKKVFGTEGYRTGGTFFTTKPAEMNAYKKLKCATDANTIIEYNKRRMINTATQTPGIAPDLYGMSGCGLWYIPEDPKTFSIHLVGILTEWPKVDRKKVVCTKVDVFTEILRQGYNLPLPQSDLYLVNVNAEDI